MNQEPCTVSELAGMTFDKTVHPRAFFDRALEIAVDTWVGLDEQFVAWLVREGHLTKDKLPIHSHANRGKYYISSTPDHSSPHFGGNWHKVGDLHVDTKYNAQEQIKNILSTLDQIGLHDPHFYLAFRTNADVR